MLREACRRRRMMGRWCVSARPGSAAESGAASAEAQKAKPQASTNYSLREVPQANGAIIANEVNIGISGTGTFTQADGTINSTFLYCGYFPGGDGTFIQNGGTTTSGEINVGVSGTGVLTLTGGTINAGSNVFLGYNATGSGTFNLAGGTLSAPSIKSVSGTGVFNFDGGTLQPTHQET